MFPSMEALLRPYPKEQLLVALRRICKEQGLPEIPRVCRRNRDAIICYFCLNCPDFPRGFPPISGGVQFPNPVFPALRAVGPFARAPAPDFPVDPVPGPVDILQSDDLPPLWGPTLTEADVNFQLAFE
jgi:hypothetical protein